MLLVRWPLVPTTFAGFPPPVNHCKRLLFKHERLVPKNVNTEHAHVCESHISLAARGPAVKPTFLIFLFSHANSNIKCTVVFLAVKVIHILSMGYGECESKLKARRETFLLNLGVYTASGSRLLTLPLDSHNVTSFWSAKVSVLRDGLWFTHRKADWAPV